MSESVYPQRLAAGDTFADGFTVRHGAKADYRNLVIIRGIEADGSIGYRELKITVPVEVTRDAPPSQD
jgi:hypothetical protein